MKIEETIGARLRAGRERQGLTLEAVGREMAGYLGKAWTPQAVWQAEKGQRDFRASQLIAFALVLEIPVVQLLAPLSGDTDAITIGDDDYELTGDDSGRLFSAVASPDGLALFDIEFELEAVADAQRALADQVQASADQLMAMVNQADLSPKVKARLKQATDKREGRDA
jgi:transcriptional regulator with XRE-family HTH domain